MTSHRPRPAHFQPFSSVQPPLTSTPLPSPAADEPPVLSPRRLLPTPLGTPQTFTGGGGWTVTAAHSLAFSSSSGAELSAGQQSAQGGSPTDSADTRY